MGRRLREDVLTQARQQRESNWSAERKQHEGTHAMPDASKPVPSAAATDGQGVTARQFDDAAFVPMSEASAERTRPPAELNSLEIVAALGAVLVAVGVFLPAASVRGRGTLSFMELGHAAGALAVSWSAFVGYAIGKRRGRDVAWGSLVAVVILAAYRSAVAADFTAGQELLNSSAWLVIAAGATFTAVAAFMIPAQTNTGFPETQVVRIGVVFTVGGCLAAISLASPLSGMFRPDAVRAIVSPEQRRFVQWGLLGGAALVCAVGWMQPKRARQGYLRLTGATVFLVGNGLLIGLSGEAPWLALIAIPWSLAALVALSTLSLGVWPSLWASLVLVAPALICVLFAMALGDVVELLFIASAPICAMTAGGWLIRCPREPVNAMLLAVLGVGFPLAIVLALGGETDDLFGFRPAEDRMLAWMTLAMLGWGWLLSLIPPRQ